MKEDFFCICSKCRKRFSYGKAIVKKRKLFNSEIEEKCCPYCGSKGFTRLDDIHLLANMAVFHSYRGQ